MNIWPRATDEEPTLGSKPAACAQRQRKSLALLHVPKCAGTSFMQSIETALGQGIHVRGFDRSLFGNFDNFDSIPRIMRRAIHLDPTQLPAQATTIMGHFSYHTLQTRYPEASLATFLREPTARLLSHWMYWRSLTWFTFRHWGADWSARLKLAKLPLENFLQHPAIASQTDNIVTRMLLWPNQHIPAEDFISPENDRQLLAIAGHRLSRFDYADIVERGPTLYQDFSNWLGTDLKPLILNPTPKMPNSCKAHLNKQLNLATLDLLQKRTRLDLELWKMVAKDKVTEQNIEKLRTAALLQAVAKFSLLLA